MEVKNCLSARLHSKMTKMCFQIKSYRCRSTKQHQILLSLIKQTDPKATASLGRFTRGRNRSFDVSAYGNCMAITPNEGTYIWVWEQTLQQYQRQAEIWRVWFGQKFFGGFFSSLEVIQGQHMENRTEITKRKDCSWEKIVFSTELCVAQEVDNWPLLRKDFINE